MTIFGLDYFVGSVVSFVITAVFSYVAVTQNYKKEVGLHESRTRFAIARRDDVLPTFDYSITLSDFFAGVFVLFLATILSWVSFLFFVAIIFCLIYEWIDGNSNKPIIRFKLPKQKQDSK